MSTKVNVDFEQLKKLRDGLGKFEEQGRNQVCVEFAKELAARLLRLVKKRTPVGVYPAGSGMVGGTLRRTWKISEIKKRGQSYDIEIINSTEYASYVEYGYRTRGCAGWVPGKFMLTMSVREIQSSTQAGLQRKLEKKLVEVLNS